VPPVICRAWSDFADCMCGTVEARTGAWRRSIIFECWIAARVKYGTQMRSRSLILPSGERRPTSSFGAATRKGARGGGTVNQEQLQDSELRG